jgi:hypothetical protein
MHGISEATWALAASTVPAARLSGGFFNASRTSADSGEAGGFGSAKKNSPQSRRKSLKRLDPDKEIQAFSFECRSPGFAGFGQFWLNLVWAWIFLGPFRLARRRLGGARKPTIDVMRPK